MTADVKKTAPVWFQARLGGSFDLHVYYSIANIGKKLDFFNRVEATTIHPPPPTFCSMLRTRKRKLEIH